jgi:hypothetical protein
MTVQFFLPACCILSLNKKKRKKFAPKLLHLLLGKMNIQGQATLTNTLFLNEFLKEMPV